MSDNIISSAKVEVRVARGSDPATPHRLTVEFVPKWCVWFVDVNPVTVSIRGRPLRVLQFDNKALALDAANKVSTEIHNSQELTQAG
jgi:hypothetical protein